MKNTISRLLLILIFGSGLGTNIYSQQSDRSGHIMGNFILGGSSIMSGGYGTEFAVAGFDLDLISKERIQLTFGYLVNISFEYGIYQNLYFGAGYHFVQDKYHIGGSLVFLPDGNVDVLTGAKAEGGYFFTKNLGISAIVLFAHGIMNDYMIFAGGMGLTIRL